MSGHPRTIKYDVGGKIFKVSSDIIDKHPNSMLARIASDEWTSVADDKSQSETSTKNDKSEAIFINGDSDRFRYVLDYLVRGRINLPLNTSRVAVLDDLKYYGVEDVNEDNILEYAGNILALNASQLEFTKRKIMELGAEAELATAKRYFQALAHRCYKRQFSDHWGQITLCVPFFADHIFNGPYQDLCSAETHHAACDKLIAKYKDLFQEFMAEYGLRCTNMETVSLTLVKFELVKADQSKDEE